MAEAVAPAVATTKPRHKLGVAALIRRRQRGAWRRLAELFALTGFALAQPVLDVTGRAPDFFLFRRPQAWQLRVVVALVVLAPPLGMWLAELAVGLFSRVAARVLHFVFLALLFGIVAVEVGKHLHGLIGIPLAVVAALAGVALAVLAARWSGLRQAMLYAVPAPLVFALLFVFGSPAGALVRAGKPVRANSVVNAPNPVPIVFVFLDEFPERALLDAHGRIDKTLFPNFAKLAKQTTWYPNATGVSGWTPFAAPAMLSGRYPQRAFAPSYLAYPQNLFTWLAGTYKLRAFETIAQLCPPSACSDTPAGHAIGMKPMLRDVAHVTKQLIRPYRAKGDPTQQFAENATVNTKPVTDPKKLPSAQFRFNEAFKNQPNRLNEFLAGLEPGPKPTLHFLHLLLPHAPHQYLPSTQSYTPVPTDFVPLTPRDDPLRKHLSMDPVLSVLGKQRLLLQTAYTDTLVGSMMKRLKSTGLWDQSLVIVTADHGSGLTPGVKPRIMDGDNAADLDWVPLFVKLPGQHGGKVDERNEQQVDLMPTIADVIGAKIPWQVDGVSLLAPPRSSPDKPWYDNPGHPEQIDLSYRDKVRFGLAPEVARPQDGVDGLFAVGPYKDLVGRKLSSFTVGSDARVGATLDSRLDVTNVDPSSGRVPAMLFGTFDGPVGDESTWVVASVNGRIAGTIPAVLGGTDEWRFLGMVGDKWFVKGANEVRLYTVDGTTLHPIPWR